MCAVARVGLMVEAILAVRRSQRVRQLQQRAIIVPRVRPPRTARVRHGHAKVLRGIISRTPGGPPSNPHRPPPTILPNFGRPHHSLEPNHALRHSSNERQAMRLLRFLFLLATCSTSLAFSAITRIHTARVSSWRRQHAATKAQLDHNGSQEFGVQKKASRPE